MMMGCITFDLRLPTFLGSSLERWDTKLSVVWCLRNTCRKFVSHAYEMVEGRKCKRKKLHEVCVCAYVYAILMLQHP